MTITAARNIAEKRRIPCILPIIGEKNILCPPFFPMQNRICPACDKPMKKHPFKYSSRQQY